MYEGSNVQKCRFLTEHTALNSLNLCWLCFRSCLWSRCQGAPTAPLSPPSACGNGPVNHVIYSTAPPVSKWSAATATIHCVVVCTPARARAFYHTMPCYCNALPYHAMLLQSTAWMQNWTKFKHHCMYTWRPGPVVMLYTWRPGVQ